MWMFFKFRMRCLLQVNFVKIYYFLFFVIILVLNTIILQNRLLIYSFSGTMLNGTFDPEDGKPEILNPDFEGSAMSVLENWLIPFPYKVAKCLDPSEYRNIEFDSHEMSELTTQKYKTK